MPASSNPLPAFHAGTLPDDQGRLLADILRQDDEWFERRHDFIQWLFPLAEVSGANPSAPRVDAAVREAFLEDPRLQMNLTASLHRTLRFLGLAMTEHGEIAPAENWPLRKRHWFVRDTHNSLRITRMIKSLALLGLEAEARALQAAVLRLCREDPDAGIGQRTQAFWLAALPGSSGTGHG